MTRRCWNTLIEGIGGQPMPPRAKMNEKWCESFLMKRIDQGGMIDAETLAAQSAASEHITRSAIAAATLVGHDYAAYLLCQAALDMATPGLSGRPPGSKTHSAEQLNKMMLDVLRDDDGSLAGRRKAVAAAVAKEPKPQQRALKGMLGRRLKKIAAQN